MIDKKFEKQNEKNILKMSKDRNFQKLTKSWFKSSEKFKDHSNFPFILNSLKSF